MAGCPALAGRPPAGNKHGRIAVNLGRGNGVRASRLPPRRRSRCARRRTEFTPRWPTYPQARAEPVRSDNAAGRSGGIDKRWLNAFKYKAFSLKAVNHETHVPTFRRPPQADPRFPRPDEVGRRPQSALGASRQGPRPAHALTSTRPAARGARRYRLTGIGEFDALFRRGRRDEGAYLQLVSAAAAQAPGRVGFVIGKKALPLAVDRNRVRRQLREVLRQARPAIEAYDVILRLKRGCPRAEFRQVAAEAARLLAALPAEPRTR
jgi:ribonuclease P protein component